MSKFCSCLLCKWLKSQKTLFSHYMGSSRFRQQNIAVSFDQSCSLLVSLFLLQTDVSNVQTWTVLSRFDPRKPLKTAPQNISYRSAGLKQLQIRCETRLKTCGISPGKNASLNKSLIHITNRTHLLRPIM